MQTLQKVQHIADKIKKMLPANYENPAIGIILGTGLGEIAAELLEKVDSIKIPFSQIPGFPQSSVQSHVGTFIFGKMNGVRILAQQGRCHLYEGRTPAEVCMGPRVMAMLGIKTLIITNAAGALNPLFESGDIMCMSDFINFTGTTPLTDDGEWVGRFPDFSQPFDLKLQKIALASALKLGMRLERGVYIGVCGPQMETPAETRMYRLWGADAIGMSTVLEVIAARDMGMAVLGLSCLTNKNLPDCMEPAPIEKVVETAEKAGKKLAILLRAICQQIIMNKSNP